MTKEDFNISFSKYSTYVQCQHKWYLQYILKLPRDESSELLFGSSVHTVIEEICTKKILQRLYKIDPDKTVRDIFMSSLKENLSKITDISFLKEFRDKNLAPIFMFQTVKIIRELNFFQRFKDWNIYKVEYQLDKLNIFENDECKILFTGFVDLILKHKREPRYLLLDWKTSGKSWDIEKKLQQNKDFYAQLCLYKNYVSKIENIPFEQIETTFINLPRNTPEDVKLFPVNLTVEETESFVNRFIYTSYKMFKHKQHLTNFEKIKMVTKENFCHRCKFNVPEFCSDSDEFQQVNVPNKEE